MSFSLKLDAASDIPENQMAEYKEAVMTWARSVSRLEPGTVESHLQVRAAQRVPVYDLTLQTLIETRDVSAERVVLPCEDGMQTAEEPLTYNKIKVWEIDFEAPEDFKEFRTIRMVPETLMVKDCVECRAQGMIECEACNGGGRSACVECRGRGRKPCESCGGMGKSNCLRCNGRGLKEGSKLLLSSDDACPGCKGDGKVVCARCTHGEMPCGFCESTGRRNCPRCDNTGKRKCATCQGRGQIASGYSCASEFKIIRNTSVASTAPVSPAILGNLFGTAGWAEPFETYDDPFTPDEVNKSSLPEIPKKEIAQLAAKLKSFATQRSRPVRQRLSIGKEDVVRITGAFDGQDLVCWYLPKTKKMIPETNPFQNLVGAAWEKARKAAEAGDWDTAVEQATKTLSYDPAHPDSIHLLEKRKKLIFRSVLLSAAAAGIAAALMDALFIFLLEKGLHKAGPAFKAVVLLSVLGPLLGMAIYPFARKMPKPKMRMGAAFGGTLAVLVLFSVVVRGFAGWDGVLRADEAAFREEFKTRLPMGVSDVYWESDLNALRELDGRYSKTRVNLSEVKLGIAKQEQLKDDLDRLTQRFKRELQEILYAGPELGLQEKIIKLENLRDFYKIRGVDVSALEAPLTNLQTQMIKGPATKRRHSVLKIERTANHAAARTTAPKSAPAKTIGRKKKVSTTGPVHATIQIKSSKAAPSKTKTKQPVKKKRTSPNFQPWNVNN